jgi:hypothetical protein
MEVAINKMKTHNTSQIHGIMLRSPQQMRSNPPSSTTSSSRSLQTKNEIKTQDEAPMKIQDGSSSFSS